MTFEKAPSLRGKPIEGRSRGNLVKQCCEADLMFYKKLLRQVAIYLTGLPRYSATLRLCRVSRNDILIMSLLFFSPSLTALTLKQHHHHTIILNKTPTHVGVINPDIAAAHVTSPHNLDIYALKPGTTTIYARDAEGGELMRQELRVIADITPLASDIARIAPSVKLTPLATGLRLSGQVSDPLQAKEITEMARAYMGGSATILNHLRIDSPCQVNLRVRVAEVSRSLDKELGVRWKSLFKAGNFLTGLTTQFARNTKEGGTLRYSFVTSDQDANIFIDALAAEGLISILAEPDLTCLSGKEASFLAGGEFPVPITNGENVDVTFREFGVRLGFAPTVLNDRQISLVVEPEVSEISEANSITVNGLRIPGLKSRKAKTTIQLRSGQSFAIAGLLQNDTSSGKSAYPYLEKLPVIGALFRSTRFKQRNSELVIVVTPYLVNPVTSSHLIKMPLDGFIPATDFHRELQGKLWEGPKGKDIDLRKIGFYS